MTSNQLAPNFVRNLGLELPVFEDVPVVYGKIRDSKIPITESFVREVGLSVPAVLMPLKSLLSIAEDEFSIVEDYCETETVPHEWGLIPEELAERPTGLGKPYSRHEDIPGYLLGAKVRKLTVIPWRARDERLELVEQGLERYEYREGGWELLDMRLGQFVCAQTDQTLQTSTFLTDIDLWIYKRK